MTEENLTKIILDWLEKKGWTIICFDFPQSGTGIKLHSNQRNKKEKNKGSFIPDIVAIKDRKVVFFENKDRFVLSDYEKVSFLKTTNNYSKSIDDLLKDFDYQSIAYGVGIPKTVRNLQKNQQYQDLVDFTIIVDEFRNLEVIFDRLAFFLPTET